MQWSNKWFGWQPTTTTTTTTTTTMRVKMTTDDDQISNGNMCLRSTNISLLVFWTLLTVFKKKNIIFNFLKLELKKKRLSHLFVAIISKYNLWYIYPQIFRHTFAHTFFLAYNQNQTNPIQSNPIKSNQKYFAQKCYSIK